MFRRLKSLTSVLIITAVFSLAIEVSFVRADIGDVEFYVTPANNNFATSTTPIGTRFNITVMWKDKAPLDEVFAWQVKLVIDITQLNCTRAWVPTWDANYLLKPGSPNWNHPAPSGLGTSAILVMGTLMPPANTVQSASALVCIFELQIMKSPPVGSELSSALNINNGDTYWSPDGLTWYDPIRTDGTYLYSSAWTPPPPAMLSVIPSATSDRSLTPGSSFNVNVTISSATDVYQFDFKLGFDKTILNVASAQLGDFFPSSIVPTITINNASGFVQVSASLAPAATPRSGSGTLATIKLQVEGTGGSSLHIYDVLLKDDSGHTLPANTNDGSFNNAALVGDITGPNGVPDGKIDVRDVALIGTCLGSRPGDKRWDPRCDFNGDHKINILDMALVARNFGQHT
jgi:hypothetical protein